MNILSFITKSFLLLLIIITITIEALAISLYMAISETYYIIKEKLN